MSNHSDVNIKVPSTTKYVWSAVAVIVLILAVSGVVVLLYFLNRPEPLNFEIVKERKAKLAEVNAKQHELISKYAWIDKEKGIVQIPIEQSMKLTVEELRNSTFGIKEAALQKESASKEATPQKEGAPVAPNKEAAASNKDAAPQKETAPAKEATSKQEQTSQKEAVLKAIDNQQSKS